MAKRTSHKIARELRWKNPNRHEWKWLAEGYTKIQTDTARRHNASLQGA